MILSNYPSTVEIRYLLDNHQYVYFIPWKKIFHHIMNYITIRVVLNFVKHRNK